MTISDILKDSDYKAEQFSAEAISRLNARLKEVEDSRVKKNVKAKCLVRALKQYPYPEPNIWP